MDTEKQARGKLILCPTPIGNLGDITERTLAALRDADIIAAEDTRNTLRLLNHFDIHTPMTSYHEHNKYEKADELVSKILSGQMIACVTDAGTPGISDPGEVLVKKAVEAGAEVTSLPGATAFVTALTVSGLPCGRFVFEGFLPTEKKERRIRLDQIKSETKTVILYEAPHRLKETLKELKDALGSKRKTAICRELTKIHEEILRLTLEEACAYHEVNEPRGEYVLVIEGKSEAEAEAERKKVFEDMTIAEHVAMYEEKGADHKEAMKQTAVDRGIPKREVYNALIEEKERDKADGGKI